MRSRRGTKFHSTTQLNYYRQFGEVSSGIQSQTYSSPSARVPCRNLGAITIPVCIDVVCHCSRHSTDPEYDQGTLFVDFIRYQLLFVYCFCIQELKMPSLINNKYSNNYKIIS